MQLVDVYETNLAHRILYDLLRERKNDQSISHRKMPSYEDHEDFVDSRPYHAWYLIQKDQTFVGSVYLSRDDEIGVFIFEKYQAEGWGPWAVEQIMSYHPREYFLANINPENSPSKRMFEKLGFKHIQETYRYESHGAG